MLYHPGDYVYCRITTDRKTILNVNFNDLRYVHCAMEVYLILAIDKNLYLILAPDSITSYTGLLDQDTLNLYSISSMYRGKKMAAVGEMAIGGKKIIDFNSTAISCCICREPVAYAQANLADGRFACFRCRTDTRNKFRL